MPRRSAQTILYAIVRDHREAFLEHARESYDRGLPHYVEQAFRAYLECGIFSHGFLRFHCDECRRDLLVAFVCKGRGVCPSCAARRMCNTAAQLVDRVLPAVPLRQWALSLPFELRRLAAFHAGLATFVVAGFDAHCRLHIEAIKRCLEASIPAGMPQPQHPVTAAHDKDRMRLEQHLEQVRALEQRMDFIGGRHPFGSVAELGDGLG